MERDEAESSSDDDGGRWTQSDMDEFVEHLSEMGVGDPQELMQLVPDGMTLAEFANYYAQLDATERASLCDTLATL